MAFIKYHKEKTKKGSSTKTVGINRKGRFVFYKPIIQKYFSDHHYVDLYYDPETRKMGIMPLKDPSTDSFKIQGKTTKMVIAKKFMNRFQITVEDKRYDFTVNDDGMLIIQL